MRPDCWLQLLLTIIASGRLFGAGIRLADADPTAIVRYDAVVAESGSRSAWESTRTINHRRNLPDGEPADGRYEFISHALSVSLGHTF